MRSSGNCDSFSMTKFVDCIRRFEKGDVSIDQVSSELQSFDKNLDMREFIFCLIDQNNRRLSLGNKIDFSYDVVFRYVRSNLLDDSFFANLFDMLYYGDLSIVILPESVQELFSEMAYGYQVAFNSDDICCYNQFDKCLNKIFCSVLSDCDIDIDKRIFICEIKVQYDFFIKSLLNNKCKVY